MITSYYELAILFCFQFPSEIHPLSSTNTLIDDFFYERALFIDFFMKFNFENGAISIIVLLTL